MGAICQTLGLTPSLQKAIETQVELELHICQASAPQHGIAPALLTQISACLTKNRLHLLAES